MEQAARWVYLVKVLTPARDGEYRAKFGGDAHTGLSPPRDLKQTLTDIVGHYPDAQVPQREHQSFEGQYRDIQNGVPATKRMFLLPVTLVALFWTLIVPIRLGSYGFLAASVGTLLITLILMIKLLVDGYANWALAWNFVKSRLLPPLPSVFMFTFTLIPALSYLQNNTGYRWGSAALQWGLYVLITYFAVVRFFFTKRRIRAFSRNLPLDQRRAIARDARSLLVAMTAFKSDIKQTGVSENMTTATTFLLGNCTRIFQFLVAQIGVKIPTPGDPWYTKAFAPLMPAIIGAVNIYAFRDEGFTQTDKIGWTLTITTVMISFMTQNHYSRAATLIEVAKYVSGTVLNTAIVAAPVLASQGSVLLNTTYFLAIMAGNAIALMICLHWVAWPFTRMFPATDENDRLVLEALDAFIGADQSGAEHSAADTPAPPAPIALEERAL